ncbi:hypothetical protein R3P38DRAFT_2354967, partial [Favolaschia claudopus]
MHFKLFLAIGERMALLEGLRALFAFVEYYRTQYDAASHGLKIHYGENREHWKATADMHGRSKFNRNSKISAADHDDYRPPDTAKALLGSKSPTKRARQVTPLVFEKGYKWQMNSCWLDASLTAIFPAASRDFAQSMEPIFSDLPDTHPLKDLRQVIHTRRAIDLRGYEDGGCKNTNGKLQEWVYFISSATESTQPFLPVVERAMCYFGMRSLTLRSCEGVNSEHFQLEDMTWRPPLQLTATACQWYKGDVRSWFADLMRPNKPEPLHACWQARDDQRFCSGDAVEYEIWLNIPIVLVIEFYDLDSGNHWTIPETLKPLSGDREAGGNGVNYTVVSHVYFDPVRQHFMTRYVSTDGQIFDHDGEKHDGHAVLREHRKTGLLHGRSDTLHNIPGNFQLYAVVYHLDGGERAQKYFRKQQMAVAEKKLSLRFTLPSQSLVRLPASCELQRSDLEQLSNDDRWWIKGPGLLTVDY